MRQLVSGSCEWTGPLEKLIAHRNCPASPAAGPAAFGLGGSFGEIRLREACRIKA